MRQLIALNAFLRCWFSEFPCQRIVISPRNPLLYEDDESVPQRVYSRQVPDLVVQRARDHEIRPFFEDEPMQVLFWSPMLSSEEYACDEARLQWHRIDQTARPIQISSRQWQQH